LRPSYSFVSILLAPLVAALPVWADAPMTPAAAVDSLQIRVLDDRTAGVVPGGRTAHALAVQVTDSAGGSIKDAAVVFRLPESGPSGRFADGSTANVVYTDAAGKADAGEVTWGTAQGSIAVRITAAKGTAHAGVLYEQMLTASIPAAPLQAAPTPVPQIVVASTPPAPIVRKTGRPAVIETSAPATIPARPGTLVQETEISGRATHDEDSADANIPLRHAFGSSLGEAPSVSIVSSGAASRGGHSKAKWIAIAAVAAGAGVALALMHTGGSTSGSSSGSTSGISIGAPTVSVGHP
jgi:hypothetical protein